MISHAEGFDVFTFHYIHMKRAHQIVSFPESCNGDVVVDFAVEHRARKNPRLASCIAELIEKSRIATPRRLRRVTLMRKQSMYSFHYVHMKRTLLICLLFRIVGWKRDSLVSEKGKLRCFPTSHSLMSMKITYSFHFFIKMKRAQLCLRVFRIIRRKRCGLAGSRERRKCTQ